MRKGRHRKRQEARRLKLGGGVSAPLEPCVECGRVEHADWCLVEELSDEDNDSDGDEDDDPDDGFWDDADLSRPRGDGPDGRSDGI